MSTPASDRVVDPAPLLALLPSRVDAAAIDDEVLALFDAFRDPLLRYVCTFGMPMGEAEDLVQDVFVALFRHLRNGGARTNLRGWLFRVAHNLALKRRARQQREHHRLRGSADAAHFVVDPAEDPEAQLARRERRRRVSAVLDALPERDRHCVRLRGRGLRYREIATVLGISLGSVAKSLSRALARLQRATGE